MKILCDHQIFTSLIYGWVSEYFYELMNGFSIILKNDMLIMLSKIWKERQG